MEVIELNARRDFISKGSRVIVRAPNGDKLVGTITFIRQSTVFVNTDAGYKLKYPIKSKSIIAEGPKKKYTKALTDKEYKEVTKGETPEKKSKKVEKPKEDKSSKGSKENADSKPAKSGKSEKVKEDSKKPNKKEDKAKDSPKSEIKKVKIPKKKEQVEEIPKEKPKKEGISLGAKKLGSIFSSNPVRKYTDDNNPETAYYVIPVEGEDTELLKKLVKAYKLDKIYICDPKSKYNYMAKIGRGQIIGIYHNRNRVFLHYFPNSFKDYTNKIYPKALDPKKAIFRFDENGNYVINVKKNK